MLQYLVILLDDTSVSYCHAVNPLTEANLMPLETLREAIIFGMKHNLMIQYVLPQYQLPDEYYIEMDSIDNIKIGQDVAVYQCIPESVKNDTVVLCLTLELFISNVYMVSNILRKTKRLCVQFTDIQTFQDSQIEQYENSLNVLKETIIDELTKGRNHDVNLITDRLNLSKMGNCNAGLNNITIAPNGKFYICPAFYYDEVQKIDTGTNYKLPSYNRSVGDLANGLNIKNRKLYELDNSPLCTICDAYHCNRCVWLNQKMTYEINTPSHEQCVMSHIERKVTKSLSEMMRGMGIESPIIKSIDYMDPFEKILKY